MHRSMKQLLIIVFSSYVCNKPNCQCKPRVWSLHVTMSLIRVQSDSGAKVKSNLITVAVKLCLVL